MRHIDVVIADDHPVVLAGLDFLLGLEPRPCRVVARCTNAGEAVDAIRAHRPAVALVKLELPDSLDVLRRVRRARLTCGVVLIGSIITEDQAVEAFRLGARGMLLKTLPGELIRECVRKVARGERWIEKDSMARVVERLASGDAGGDDGILTSRERQIGRLAAEGLRNSEIASRLGISVGTVKVHLHNVYRKLRVRGRVQLAADPRIRPPR